MERKGDFEKRQCAFSGIPLVLSPHWMFLPGIWRTSFIKPFFENDARPFPKSSVFAWEFNRLVKKQENVNTFRDADWMQKNVGAYIYGSHGGGYFINHLGLNSARLGEVR
jgi:hypothetical protein